MTDLIEKNELKSKISPPELFSRDKLILTIFTLVTCVKILLIPT